MTSVRDQESFERYVLVHRPFVVHKLQSLGFHPGMEGFDDVVNDVFRRAWQRWDEYDPRYTVCTWLGKYIMGARTKWWNAYYCHREEFHRSLETLPDWEAEGEARREPFHDDGRQMLEAMVREDDATALWMTIDHWLAQLPEDCQLTLRTFLKHDGSFIESGRSLGMSRQGFYHRYVRALHHLRNIATAA